MILLAGAAAQNTDSSALQWTEIKIMPPALEVLSGVARFRKANGRWPEKKDLTVPEGVTNIALTQGPDQLEITVADGGHTLLHCYMLPDGTAVLRTPAGELMKAIHSARQESRGSSWPTPTYIPIP